MVIGISFISCTLIYMFLLCVVYFTKSRVKTIETRIYDQLLILNVIGLILELTCCFTVKNMDIYPLLNVICNRLYLIYFVFFVTVFTLYVYVACDKATEINTESDLKLNKIEKVVVAIAFILAIGLVIVLPLQYNNEVNAVYSYGQATDFLSILCLIYMLFDFIVMSKNFKKLNKKKLIPMFTLLICFVFAFIIRQLNPGIILITCSFSFVTAVMYFTIENPDMKMITELNEAKAQAEKANNAKSEFLSNMSHEIRTPLNAIVGFSQALEEEDISGEAKEEVRDIVRASQSLLEIVNGILDISKIEANKIEIVNGEYDIYEILDDLVALTKARMGEKPLDFRIDFDPTIPHILYGDKTRIKQVILNLLTNSVKYTKEGYVEFKVSSVRKDDICRLIVSVEDSGIGIKKENLDKLFSKFERFDLDKNITIEGTGLGLAITKKLVELMHGKIVVQSIYGKGSRFTIAVDQKVVNKEKLEETDKVTDEIIDLTGKKILLVDDNNLNLKVASKLLEKYNASITTLTSGNDCLEKIKTNEHFDLILLDDMMPGMSGIETIKKLREMDNYNIPTIALTANAIEGVRQKYIDAGFDDYLSKPIEKRELNRVITKFLK